MIMKCDQTCEMESVRMLHKFTYVTGFERTRLPCTQQEDTLFTVTR